MFAPGRSIAIVPIIVLVLELVPVLEFSSTCWFYRLCFSWMTNSFSCGLCDALHGAGPPGIAKAGGGCLVQPCRKRCIIACYSDLISYEEKATPHPDPVRAI